MKRSLSTLRLLPAFAVVVVALLSACNNDDDTNTWEEYADWRDANNAFFDQEKYRYGTDGELFYTTLVPAWYSGGEILIKYLNDRSLTQGNLSPLATSVVQVKYKGTLYDGTPFDSSYKATDSTFTTALSQVIAGWQTALQYMRVGDSVRVVIPSSQGYGSSVTGSIPPYSTLLFDIKLKNITDYEAKP